MPEWKCAFLIQFGEQLSLIQEQERVAAQAQKGETFGKLGPCQTRNY